MAVDNLTSRLHLTVSSVRETAETCARFKSCVDGCLSRLANYEQRVGVATRRVAAFRGRDFAAFSCIVGTLLILQITNTMSQSCTCTLYTRAKVSCTCIYCIHACMTETLNNGHIGLDLKLFSVCPNYAQQC